MTDAPRPVTPLSILARKLQELQAELADLPAATAARLAEAVALAAGLDPYLDECASPESPALANLARRTASEDWSALTPDSATVPLEQEMLSGHVEGQFLRLLVKAVRARRVLDIGMFTGYSALAMAEALPDDGVVVACEVDGRVAEIARECFGESPAGTRIEVHVGPARRTLETLSDAGERFDLVFIDADKAGYAGYLTTLLDRGLLAEGALVCVDNTLLQGQPYTGSHVSANGAAVAEFNRIVAAESRVEQVLIPLRDGITLIRRVDGE